jgi:hypothetical protein
MTMHKITELYTEWFSVCPNIEFHTIAILESFIKKRFE